MPDNGRIKIRRALISVSDKTGLEQLARDLYELGIKIISTGGTSKAIKEAGVSAIEVSEFTGSPEVMDGRVKTLNPKVHGGILYRRDHDGDIADLKTLKGKPIDLVIVNLYPFQQTLATPGVTEAELIENIDIGGPTLIRGAAKNADFVTVVTSPTDYAELIKQLQENDRATDLEFRKKCAEKAFDMTADYDAAIAGYFASRGLAKDNPFAPKLRPTFSLMTTTRYGENPHQKGAIYKQDYYSGPTLLDAQILAANKAVSYNNYRDLDACLDMLLDFQEPFACLLKHRNPCGAASAENIATAYEAAFATDPLSAFGCVIGLNREVDLDCARLVHDTKFVECILAPSFTKEALALLRKKKQRRILALPAITEGWPQKQLIGAFIRGGLVLQESDDLVVGSDELQIVTDRGPTEEELHSLLFAYKMVKHTISNAIVLTKGTATVGIGMGQTSRVDSGFMAVKRAGERTKGAVCASDAFFPMPDGVKVCTDGGVTAFIQPGGSKGDDAAIEAANKAGAAMVFTGLRHFKH